MVASRWRWSPERWLLASRIFSKVLLISARWRADSVTVQTRSKSSVWDSAVTFFLLCRLRVVTGLHAEIRQLLFHSNGLFHEVCASSFFYRLALWKGGEFSLSLLVSSVNKKCPCIQFFKLFRNNLVSEQFKGAWLMYANHTVQLKFVYHTKMSILSPVISKC